MVPLLNCQSVSIWQLQLLRTAKWIRTLFKIFANKIAFLLTDGFERFGIIRTHSHLLTHSEGSTVLDFAAAEQAAERCPYQAAARFVYGMTAPPHADRLLHRSLPQSAGRSQLPYQAVRGPYRPVSL